MKRAAIHGVFEAARPDPSFSAHQGIERYRLVEISRRRDSVLCVLCNDRMGRKHWANERLTKRRGKAPFTDHCHDHHANHKDSSCRSDRRTGHTMAPTE